MEYYEAKESVHKSRNELKAIAGKYGQISHNLTDNLSMEETISSLHHVTAGAFNPDYA